MACFGKCDYDSISTFGMQRFMRQQRVFVAFGNFECHRFGFDDNPVRLHLHCFRDSLHMLSSFWAQFTASIKPFIATDQPMTLLSPIKHDFTPLLNVGTCRHRDCIFRQWFDAAMNTGDCGIRGILRV